MWIFLEVFISLRLVKATIDSVLLALVHLSRRSLISSVKLCQDGWVAGQPGGQLLNLMIAQAQLEPIKIFTEK